MMQLLPNSGAVSINWFTFDCSDLKFQLYIGNSATTEQDKMMNGSQWFLG